MREKFILNQGNALRTMMTETMFDDFTDIRLTLKHKILFLGYEANLFLFIRYVYNRSRSYKITIIRSYWDDDTNPTN